MARPRGIGRRCSFESLEDRRLLAGDVTAKIVHGNLVILGDNLDNDIAITAGANPSDVVVTGKDTGDSPTSVNGSANGAVTLSGFTGKLIIKTKRGDDSVSIDGITTSGKAKIIGGDGDDTLDISDSTFDRALTTKLGAGVDTLSLDSTTVVGKTKLFEQSGADDATITDSTFSMLGVWLGKGDDSLTVSGTTVNEKTKFNGQRGTNTYTDDGDNSLTGMATQHFADTAPSAPSTPPTPSDEVTLNPVAAISEGGIATLTGTYTDSVTSSSHTLRVAWGDQSSSVDSTFAVPAATSLTAGQQITSSTDSAILTVTSISAGQIHYSVQHRYLDDGAAAGSAAASGTSTITVTVTDGGSFNDASSTTVAISDSVPTVVLDPVSDVNENSAATLTGVYTDAGLLDAETLVVTWDDPNNSATSTFAIPAIKNADGTSSLTVGQTLTSSIDGAMLTIASIGDAGQVGFSVEHTYLDDGRSIGNVTASDTGTISVSVTDDDAKIGTTTTGVKVNNVAPTLSLNTPSAATVNTTFALTGTYTDIGMSDEHGITVDWGDGTESQIRTDGLHDGAGAAKLTMGETFTSTTDSGVLTITSIDPNTGQVGFSISHQYTAAGTNLPISATLFDDDTASDSKSTTVTVHVAQPTVVVSPTFSVNEAGTLSLTGSFTNAIVTDTHDLTVSWDDPNNSNDSTFALPATNSLNQGQIIASSTDSAFLTITSVNATTGQVGFSVQHLYVDDGASSTGNSTASDDSLVLVYVTGSSAGSSFKLTTVTVNNTAPAVVLNPVSNINVNGTATVTGTFTDIGLLDTHTIRINRGDLGSSANATFTIDRTSFLVKDETFHSAANDAVLTITSVDFSTGMVGFSVQHQYTAAGSPTVSVTVADDDASSGSATVSFIVESA